MQKKDNSYYIDGIASGDAKILSEIYKDFLPNVRRFVLREKGSETDADDVFNQVLMQLYARLKVKKFEIQSTFEGYLFTACKNIWRRELNKKSRERVTKQGYAEHRGEASDFSRRNLEQEMWELYEEKFAELSDNCKEVLQLHLKKVSGKEIMEQLGYASEVTVRQRIFKCKSSLIKKIKSDKRFSS